MKIVDEKNVEMVQMNCEFTDEEVKRLREYYTTHTSEGEKSWVEINWAVVDILTKEANIRKTWFAKMQQIMNLITTFSKEKTKDYVYQYFKKTVKKRDSKGRFCK